MQSLTIKTAHVPLHTLSSGGDRSWSDIDHGSLSTYRWFEQTSAFRLMVIGAIHDLAITPHSPGALRSPRTLVQEVEAIVVRSSR
jgi:hypothetical protein